MQTCVPIGTHVPDRHAVCRSYRPVYQGDKTKSAHFSMKEFVPICADAVGLLGFAEHQATEESFANHV